jgi:hypothetical protein
MYTCYIELCGFFVIFIFQPANLDFILAAANLKAEVHGIPQNRNLGQVAEIVAGVDVPVFKPAENAKIAVTEDEVEEATADSEGVGLVTHVHII